MRLIRSLPRDISLSVIVAGVVATLVGYSGSLVIVLEATRAADISQAQVASWIWAISIGSGICGLVLTAVIRMPIIIAWSTPGAALLIASLAGLTFGEAVGAFIVASAAATIVGLTGWFGKLLARIPQPLLQALLAGVLLPIVIDGAREFESAPLLAGSIVGVFILEKCFFDSYAILAALLMGIVVASATGEFGRVAAELALTIPVFTMPEFTLSAIVSVALPLFIVTMASQNAPGLALLRHEGYEPSDRLLVGGVSAVSTLLTPFGNHGICMAAISAAVATGSASHPDRQRRYVAGLSAGLVYLVLGSFGGYLISVFEAFPAAVITTLAAVGLLSPTLGALKGAMVLEPRTGLAAMATLTTTMSGVVLLGAGSAF